MTAAPKIAVSASADIAPSVQADQAPVRGDAVKNRVALELLLLRVGVHGAEVAFEPGHLRLLDHLRRRDRAGFLQVCHELEDLGIWREDILAGIAAVCDED